MAVETSSKAYLPASLALIILAIQGLYAEYSWVFGDDIENAIIVGLSTTLALVLGCIYLRRLLG